MKSKLRLPQAPLSEEVKPEFHPAWPRIFRANLNAIREWYRAKDAGHYQGLNVMLEISSSDTINALDLAFEGRTWEPPK